MSSKQIIRKYLDQVASTTGLLDYLISRMFPGIIILNYHRVLPEEQCKNYPLTALAIPDTFFNQQMAWLKENCKVLPLDEAVTSIQKGYSDRKPTVCVTFDDGYIDNYTIAAPILEEHNLRGTFFITTEFVLSKSYLWHDIAALAWVCNDQIELLDKTASLFDSLTIDQEKINSIKDWMNYLKGLPTTTRSNILCGLTNQSITDKLENYNPMSIEQIIELGKRGHEIASHTCNHPILTLLDDEELALEINHSKYQLEEWINEPIAGFCYPNGDNNNKVISYVEQSGYKYACTTSEGMNKNITQPMTLKRINIETSRVSDNLGSYNENAFIAELTGFHAWFR